MTRLPGRLGWGPPQGVLKGCVLIGYAFTGCVLEDNPAFRLNGASSQTEGLPNATSTGTPTPGTQTAGTFVGGTVTAGASTTGELNRSSSDAETDSDTSGNPTTVLYEFEERDGVVVFEAEHFWSQTINPDNLLEWHDTTVSDGAPTSEEIPGCVPLTECTAENFPLCTAYADCDVESTAPNLASGGHYLESLPDRFRGPALGNTPVDTAPRSFAPGEAAVLTYRVRFSQTGRYYAYSRGQATVFDNTVFLGLDGTWPINPLGSAGNMVWEYPVGPDFSFSNWREAPDSSTVEGEVVPGESFADANMWLEIETPGWHEIQVSVREDGLSIDKFMFVLDPSDAPLPDDLGPEETLYSG